ncbi:MAG: hypothetical protein IT305_11955 [Chloroflexi bacterium]|nr:hypothetical protein [Chloroflexota bacterium]
MPFGDAAISQLVSVGQRRRGSVEAIRYELWDTETGNFIEALDNEADALHKAREPISLNADVYPAMLTLLAVNERGEGATVAAGGDLGMLVRSAPDRD